MCLRNTIQYKEANRTLLFTVTVQALVQVELVNLIRDKQGGHGSIEEQKERINYLQFYAGFLTLKALYSNVSNVHIRLCMDNSVSVSYLNNMSGRKKKFNTLTKMIWLWCIDRNIILSSAHIARSGNLTADILSRDRNIDKNGN